MTPKQLKTLRFIDSFIRSNGYSPSYREISDHLGVKSLGGTQLHVKALKRSGYISFMPTMKRDIEITGKGEKHLSNLEGNNVRN